MRKSYSSEFKLKAAAPHLKRLEAARSSALRLIAALGAFPGLNPDSTASKGVSRMLTKSAAPKYASHNIRLNAVNPGMIITTMSAGGLNSESETRELLHVPEEVASAVLFLTSDQTSYVTTANLAVDVHFDLTPRRRPRRRQSRCYNIR
ncbi:MULTISPECIES: SDR family oxidoreductase [unclassified Pseudomonas]|uniref:SDR family NAD(P)-dependent oxidoreductase n=1 Tax=unclassified Pseudomonas TaxID=196821 RepID=UPI001AE3AD81|nr:MULTISPECIES: SDR family oxidoreductase [unclassified Pseudomonas]MBP2271445.1 NAD(P)-dependent dehydrogenase (short-subunit alcohol dehydrogenase family) [Pseudomonas sp. BP6]MBP2289584.1 NAD(P)-dependent dehydrogenase (short-subunit alcohol dehydrogenase family) [Pseudomonas sp. BP7]HDS1695130.1 SDR family oxidoreductase [Pseudomonas putida]HDS1700300.1 SDR family oxidoreductase [Pseudomonas putida]